MTDLSPAAQAVCDAFWNGILYNDDITDSNIAAALRAAADLLSHKPSILEIYMLANELEGNNETSL
jgi:hypothetical protein